MQSGHVHRLHRLVKPPVVMPARGHCCYPTNKHQYLNVESYRSLRLNALAAVDPARPTSSQSR